LHVAIRSESCERRRYCGNFSLRRNNTCARDVSGHIKPQSKWVGSIMGALLMMAIARAKKIARLAGSVYRSNMAVYCCITECFLTRSTVLRANLHPATRSARRGPRACGARKSFLFALYGTTSQPSIRGTHLVLTLKSCPDTCFADRSA
jgi:hypothetical protein